MAFIVPIIWVNESICTFFFFFFYLFPFCTFPSPLMVPDPRLLASAVRTADVTSILNEQLVHLHRTSCTESLHLGLMLRSCLKILNFILSLCFMVKSEDIMEHRQGNLKKKNYDLSKGKLKEKVTL